MIVVASATSVVVVAVVAFGRPISFKCVIIVVVVVVVMTGGYHFVVDVVVHFQSEISGGELLRCRNVKISLENNANPCSE